MKKWVPVFLAVFGAVSFGVLVHDRIRNRRCRHHRQGFYEKYIKRVQDFWCAAIALAILSPVMAVTAVLVRKKLGPPVVFRQKRPGKDGQVFELYKFRTMTDGRDRRGKLLPDEDRLTEFGRKLRATSLDELPELVNIIRGDMSVVGPRPLLVKYLPLYSERQRHRHDVRPGLTGLAQVSGRNAISWEGKFEDDLHYINNITFLDDWRIVVKTIGTVWKRSGISSETGATMEEFRGTE